MLLRSIIFATSALAMVSTTQAADVLRMGGGPSGGAWHPAWSAGTQLLNQKLSGKYVFQYTPTAGSVDNARKVRLQELASGWSHIPQVYESWYGEGGFKKDGPSHDFRVIGNVRQQTQIIAVLADSPIKSFSDMKGKVVSLLNKGSGSSANCVKMFTALGLIDKIEARYMDFSASARALGDRQIDVFCSAGVPFTIPALTQLSLTKPVRYISLSPAELKQLTSTFKFYAPVTIPVQKDVKGMTEPAVTIGYDVWWIVSKKMSDEAVYDVLKTVAEPTNLKTLSSTARYWGSLSGKFDSLKEHKISIHPAAAKYWKERGENVPAELVKGYEGS
ncbi:MAG: TAXI family TRAP transporter solute-binding subunit [Pseudolabrys sp.]|nr:TAXI family TRAP transporter solute-binding subunit [Pseudolabrys sp.]